jgi:hypothetical protein
MDYSQITNVEVEDIDTYDYPDFCDAYISSAEYKGKEMTEDQLEELNDDGDFVYQSALSQVF